MTIFRYDLQFRHCEEAAGDEAIQTRRNTGLLRFARNDGWVVKLPAVYIMANKRNGTLYAGVTSQLPQRVWQHREGVADGFTKRYGCKMLVWYEMAPTMEAAIMREKRIKGGSRARKLVLIEGMNPEWRDLYEDIANG